ncbi:mercury resistance system transport protein MerF [Dongia sp.]|jgi:mercuric ion transport protein|uniref:mercury resistance system transport protein MerF n=1 Tax=Dongia sp. TaxID=1977262 RepID=UPI0035B0E37A
MADRSLVGVGIIGTGLVSLCCFAHILVGLLGVGLWALSGYLISILMPVLIVAMAVAAYVIWQRRREPRPLHREGKSDEFLHHQ